MLTRAEENYLKTIFHLEKDSSEEVSTKAIAEKMETKPSSVTDMVQKMAEKDLLIYKRYQGVLLTERGRKAAANVIRKHRLWEVFLVEKLNFQWDEVHEIAEQMEHIQSDELIKRLDNYLGNPDFDPHGDPIPDKHGVIKKTSKNCFQNYKKDKAAFAWASNRPVPSFFNISTRKTLELAPKSSLWERNSLTGR